MSNVIPKIIFDDTDEKLEVELDIENFNKKSVYNVPGYKPVRRELKHAPVVVTGSLPADLEGVYLRNGTNVQFEQSHIRSHAFCGAGMIHQIEIKDGMATYSNFYVRTPRFEIERKIGREIFIDFTDIAGGGPQAIEKIKHVNEKKKRGLIPNLSQYELTTGSTSVRYHSGRIYCLQDKVTHSSLARRKRTADL
jgi:carotenoid cleavage dioxygenase